MNAAIQGLDEQFSGKQLAQVPSEGLPVESKTPREILESDPGRRNGLIEEDPSGMGKGGEDSEGIPDRMIVLGEFLLESGEEVAHETLWILGWRVIHGATPAFDLQYPPRFQRPERFAGEREGRGELSGDFGDGQR